MTTKHCWQCGAPQLSDLELDKRARKWRVRIRLYDMIADDTEPRADSDPELSPDQPGTLICAGLKGVVDTVLQLAVAYHGTGALSGLDTETLDARIPGLRPTLSRRGGNAVWRIPYDTVRSFDPTGQRKPAWLARVDLERINPEAPKRAPQGFRRGDEV
jgi:hypothetical protein